MSGQTTLMGSVQRPPCSSVHPAMRAELPLSRERCDGPQAVRCSTCWCPEEELVTSAALRASAGAWLRCFVASKHLVLVELCAGPISACLTCRVGASDGTSAAVVGKPVSSRPAAAAATMSASYQYSQHSDQRRVPDQQSWRWNNSCTLRHLTCARRHRTLAVVRNVRLRASL